MPLDQCGKTFFQHVEVERPLQAKRADDIVERRFRFHLRRKP